MAESPSRQQDGRDAPRGEAAVRAVQEELRLATPARQGGPAVPLFLLDATPIMFDLPCVRCGYNLRGLPRTGRCPECGRAIADAFRGDRLDFASPPWVHRLAAGAALLAAGDIVLLLTLASLAVADAWLGQGAGLAAAALLHAIGITLVTEGEPRMVDARGTALLALAARAGGAALFLAMGAVVVFPLPLPFSLALAALAAAAFPRGFYLRLLARRVPNDSLAAWLLNLSWGVAAAFFCIALTTLVAADTGTGVLTNALCCAMPLIGSSLLTWAWVTLRLARELRACAKLGEKNRS